MNRFRKILSPPPWVVAVIGFLILLPSISRQSLGLEESQTWNYARLHSPSESWATLQSDQNIEAQMPLAMIAASGWSEVFGTDEWAMRSINLLWLAVALAALTLVAREASMPWLPLLFAIQPFVWYSMDSARPQLMQMAGGALLLAGTLKLLNGSNRWLKIALLLSAGSLILCGTNIFGVVPLIVLLTLLLGTAAWRNLLVARESKIFLFLTGGLLMLIGVYYLSTLIRGAGGVKLWSVTPLNLLAVVYEFLGFTGLGPSRQELREILRGAVPATELWSHLPGWICLAGAYALVGIAAAKSWLTRVECGPRKPPFRLWAFCALVPVLSGFLLFCLATAYGIPFWGQHLAGTLPFSVTTLAVLIHWSTQGLWRRAGRLASLLVIGLLLLSSGLIRGLPRHKHDDYRGAARAVLALSTRESVIWWVAGEAGGKYYGLTFVKEGPGIVHSPNRTVAPASLPEALVISRPENFDSLGIAGDLIRSGSYQEVAKLQAFEVWKRVDK